MNLPSCLKQNWFEVIDMYKVPSKDSLFTYNIHLKIKELYYNICSRDFVRMTLATVDESIVSRVTTLIDDVWQQAGNICRCYYVNSYSARSIEKKRTKNGLVRGRSTATATPTPSPPPTPPTTPTWPTSLPRPPPASSSPASRSLHATTWLTAAAGLCDTHHTKSVLVQNQFFVCVSKKYYLLVHYRISILVSRNTTKSLDKSFHFYFLKYSRTW